MMRDSVFLRFCDQIKLVLLYKIQKKLQAVGVVTKVAIQQEVGAGRNVIGTAKMSNPLHIFKDISSEDLDEERKIERFKKYSFSKGFSKFEVTV